jgi:hypothetical protein
MPANFGTKRGVMSRDYKIDNLDLRRRAIEEALPAHFLEEYPKFVDFLIVYYDFLDAEEGLDKVIERLVDIRNPDIANGKYRKRLRREYGPEFPDFGTLDDATALKIFEKWYKSKGNREAMEAYFRIFLNTDAEVIYPKDNMLRVSDGEWNDEEKRYINQRGHISETTMVIQDSAFYQIFSYLIKSGVSISDWGPNFRSLAHPAGWTVFGQVAVEALTQFEYLLKSPTFVPGSQSLNVDLLILGAALFYAVGNFDPSPNPMRLRALRQFITKVLEKSLAQTNQRLTLEAVNKNLLLSTHTIGELGDFDISDFSPIVAGDVVYTGQRPARIMSDSLTSNANFIDGLTNWEFASFEAGTADVVNGVLNITKTVGSGNAPRLSQLINLEVGKTYIAWAKIRNVDATSVRFYVSNTATGISIGSGTFHGAIIHEGTDFILAPIIFTATETTHRVMIVCMAGEDNKTVQCEYVVVRRI